MVGREDKRTNNRTMFPALKDNAAVGYKSPVKIELMKGRFRETVITNAACRFTVHSMHSVEPKSKCLGNFDYNNRTTSDIVII